MKTMFSDHPARQLRQQLYFAYSNTKTQSLKHLDKQGKRQKDNEEATHSWISCYTTETDCWREYPGIYHVDNAATAPNTTSSFLLIKTFPREGKTLLTHEPQNSSQVQEHGNIELQHNPKVSWSSDWIWVKKSFGSTYAVLALLSQAFQR